MKKYCFFVTFTIEARVQLDFFQIPQKHQCEKILFFSSYLHFSISFHFFFFFLFSQSKHFSQKSFRKMFNLLQR